MPLMMRSMAMFLYNRSQAFVKAQHKRKKKPVNST